MGAIERATSYEAVIVLCGGLAKHGRNFVPTSFANSDAYGMLGGNIRVVAAACLYATNVATTFVFSTGTSQKRRDQFGEHSPPEARIYANYFNHLIQQPPFSTLQQAPLQKPTIVLETESYNTATNIQRIIHLLMAHRWINVALLSSGYHLSRVKALYTHFKPAGYSNPVLLSAETIVQNILPGVYDGVIVAAYASPEGLKRERNERQGVIDLRNGISPIGEHNKSLQGRPR